MIEKVQRLPDYLGHIVEAINRIEEYVAGLDRSAFISNKLVVDAVIRNIEVIGEASNKVRRHIENSRMPIQKCPGKAVTR